MADVNEILASFAEKHNTIIGVCHALPLETTRGAASPFLSAVDSSPFVPFVSCDAERRTNPAATLPSVESIMVIGVESSAENNLSPTPCLHSGNSLTGGEAVSANQVRTMTESWLQPSATAYFSSLGTCADYHKRVRELLRELASELKQTHGGFKYKILVDGGGLDERALAVRAGIGFYGRHGLVISQEFGTRFNIGCLLTNIPLEKFQKGSFNGNFSEKSSNESFFEEGSGEIFFPKKVPPENFSCPPSCNLCIKSCPTDALGGDFLRASRCISYLTQKDELTAEEEKLLANAGQLYGCDICQDVCPFNAARPPLGERVNPAEWLTMSDEDFRQQYGHTSMLWRGAEILRRNAHAMRRATP